MNENERLFRRRLDLCSMIVFQPPSATRAKPAQLRNSCQIMAPDGQGSGDRSDDGIQKGEGRARRAELSIVCASRPSALHSQPQSQKGVSLSSMLSPSVSKCQQRKAPKGYPTGRQLASEWNVSSHCLTRKMCQQRKAPKAQRVPMNWSSVRNSSECEWNVSSHCLTRKIQHRSRVVKVALLPVFQGFPSWGHSQY